MRCLVTGAAGFIGSHLVERLLKDGHIVVGVDNLSNGRIENILDFLDVHSKKRIDDNYVVINHQFCFYEDDIRDLDFCYHRMHGVDVVFHQAALGSVPRSVDDPISTNEVNVTGTVNLLEAARKNGVKKFVYASSASVYGDQNEHRKQLFI